MGSPSASSFADRVLAAPAGVALLARLEAQHRSDGNWFDSPRASDPEAVRRAVTALGSMRLDELLSFALDAERRLAGPWVGDAPEQLVQAYRFAADRRPIADALEARFGRSLHAPADLGAQEWWHSNHAKAGFFARARFTDFGQVYANGEFTWDGLWTATAPPPETHEDLASIWEILPGPVSRWRLPVSRRIRVWQIDQPTDWVRLVETYPKVATRAHAGWELPGPNQRVHNVETLLSVPGQNAVRASIDRLVLPDWAEVAADYEGVRLSWAGFITTEGFVSDLAGSGVTMLRHWGAERTLWLADVFGDPSPLDPTGARVEQDLEVLNALLGR